MVQKEKKVRLGQYYTSSEIADLIVSLAEAPKNGAVMEAGYGEGAFLEALQKAGYRNITGYDIDKENYRKCSARFKGVDLQSESFLNAPRDKIYDLVIGNPPYVRWGNLDRKTQKLLLKDPFWKQYSSGEWDLLYAFIVLGVEILRPGGELIFIVPYNWFSATYAASLRGYLTSLGSFTDIIHFSEYKVFKDASPNTIVFRFLKKKSSQPIRTIELLSRKKKGSDIAPGIRSCREKLLAGKEGFFEDWRYFFSPQPKDSRPWYLVNKKEGQRLRRIENRASLLLSDVAHVGVGLVSGYDRAFAIGEEFFCGLNKKEKELVRPFIKAKNCQPFCLRNTSLFLFADSIKSEKELKMFPHIYEHLLSYKNELLARWGAQQDTWWHWATVRNLDLFQKNLKRAKIFVPCIDRSPRARFAISRGSYLGSGDVLLIVPKGNPYYLQAWLSSETFNLWYSLKGPRSGERTKYTQSFLSGAPALPIDNLPASDRQRVILNSKKLAAGSGDSDLIGENDAIFARLF